MIRRLLAAAALLASAVLTPVLATPQGVTIGADRTNPAAPTLCITNLTLCLANIGTYQGGRFAITGGDFGANLMAQPGADPTAVNDSASQLTNMFTTASAGTKQSFIPPGSYKFGTAVGLPQNSTMEAEGSVFSGTGGITNVGDGSPLLNPFGHAFLQRTNVPGTQDTVYASLFIDNTGGSAPAYEKSAGYFITVQNDPSVYGGTSRDGVAISAYSIGGIANPNSHLYGLNPVTIYQCSAPTGSTTCAADGSGETAEFDSVNLSSDQPDYTSQLAKTGVGIIAGGTNPSSVALHIGGYSVPASGVPTAGWHSGIYVDGPTIRDYAFKVADVTNNTLMSISPTGSVQLSAAVTNSAGTTQANATGLISDLTAITSGAQASGVVIPTQHVRALKTVWNYTANTIIVYPPPGANFAGYAANAGLTLASGAKGSYSCLSATFCVFGN